MNTGVQFGRKVSLLIASKNQALDLSNMRITFKVNAADVETPNTAIIRVYNLSAGTVNSSIKEYDSVILQAGYEGGNFGIIFKGTIKQFRKGKESNVDSYLDILAADGDLGYNFGVVNTTLEAAGTSPQQQGDVLAKAMGLPLDPNANTALAGGVLPRGKVMFGLARLYMRDLATSKLSRWSINNGQVTVIPLKGYLPGQVVKINSATGMIGIPEATNNGVNAKVLLNPLIQIGTRVQINNKDVTQTIVKEQFFPSYTSGPTLIADTTRDGVYRVLVAEHSGDTRGTDWYTSIVCLALDPTAPASSAVLPFG